MLLGGWGGGRGWCLPREAPRLLLTGSVTMANSLVLSAWACSSIKWGAGAYVEAGGLPRSGRPARTGPCTRQLKPD